MADVKPSSDTIMGLQLDTQQPASGLSTNSTAANFAAVLEGLQSFPTGSEAVDANGTLPAGIFSVGDK